MYCLVQYISPMTIYIFCRTVTKNYINSRIKESFLSYYEVITTRHDQIYDKDFRASLDLISPNRILSSHYTQRRITYSSNFADASCMCRVCRYTWWSPGYSTRGCWTAPNPPSSSRSHSIHSRIMSRTIMAEITYKNVRFCLYKVHCNQACMKKKQH